MIPAHGQNQTIRLHRAYPAHEPRSSDPSYHLFEQARNRIKKSGQWACAVGNADCGGQLELHHDEIEFADINDVDVAELDKVLGLHLTDADFQEWVESPGNLEVLCLVHHTGLLGIHLIPTADWTIVRAHRGLPPVEVVRGTQQSPPVT